ncbi:MAG: hypothetical protein K2V38_23585 [Gemmataceae bacterium]|nr:hypothetical protein [Gemmataceae bacterium]
MPPLVRCDQCEHQVAAEAETCPGCGVGLPARGFNAGALHIRCKECSASNHYFQGWREGRACRACGASLEEPWRSKDADYAARRAIVIVTVLGAVFGGLGGCATGGPGAGFMGGLAVGLIGGLLSYARYVILAAYHGWW